MPIRPENKHRYPPRNEWLKIRADILERANNCCEFCSVANYSVRNNSTIVLTIAHLDHAPENNDPSNLKALCQKCHLAYDAEEHSQTRKQTFFKRRCALNNDLFLETL